MGAFTAGLFHGIGNIFAGAGRSLLTRMEDIGAHGLAGGISSIIGGGKFGAGFFSAGFSEFASPLTLGLNSAYEGAFASAMIGGTASVISGGKFVNGAETGAFSFIFNDWAHAYQQAKSEAKAWVQRIGEAWDQYSDTINLGLNEFAIAGLFVPGVGELEAGAIIAEEALAVNVEKSVDNLPTTRAALDADLTEKGFKFKGVSQKNGYTTYKGPDGKTVTVKPTGEVIPVQKVWKSDGSGKFPQRQDYNGKPLPDQSHSTGHYVEPTVGPFKGNN